MNKQCPGSPLEHYSCQFVASGLDFHSLPPCLVPEIAFVGRSNVGKSSLINALLGRKKLAYTSKTPGRTRSINFFSLASRLYIVDLPGYGYAKLSFKERHQWATHLEQYIQKRSSLSCVNILIDSRRGPKPLDLQMANALQFFKSYQIILTKIDELTPQKLEHVLKHTQSIFHNVPIFLTSVLRKNSLHSLCANIESFMVASP